MRTSLRSLSLGVATVLGMAAFAQPTPPFSVTITGTVLGCTPMSYVNIQTAPGTVPVTDVDVPVLPPNCTFSITLEMDSYQGAYILSTPCQGVMQSQTLGYTVNSFFPDSTYVTVVFNCGNSAVDCNGVLGGSALPGTPCDDNNPLTNNDVWSANCECEGNGGGNVDCLGVPGGLDLPGTACVNALGVTGIWGADCWCYTDTTGGPADCMGVPSGNNLPGTACTYTNDNGATWLTGIWSADCVCNGDSTGAYDCLGMLNGSNLPGSPCWVFGTNFIGTWDANCDCIAGSGPDCQAGFWAIQAYEMDSVNPNGTGNPIPFEVWVWNLSTGAGTMSYAWDFGDGSTSTDPYPTHTYAAEGPYWLCLTIDDGTGCTDQFCDSISIDGDGILSGLVLENEVDGNGARQDGFTINVQNPLTTGMSNAPMLSNLALWPNPAADVVNLALVSLANGQLSLSLFDVNGREVVRENRALTTGRSQHALDTSALPAGLYTVRATDRAGNGISMRFAKQ